jgi:hypothetical protein
MSFYLQQYQKYHRKARACLQQANRFTVLDDKAKAWWRRRAAEYFDMALTYLRYERGRRHA